MNGFREFLERNYEKTWVGFAVSVLTSLVTVGLPTYFCGIRRTDDMESHFHFAHAFREGLARGDLYVGWANDNLGFGSVGVRFYPPASAYIAALLHSVTADWHAAYFLSLVAFMTLGCFGVYLFVREWSTPTYGVLGAVLYAVVPYHIAQIYRFFLYAEFAAMAVLPFCIFYTTRLCRRGQWRDVIPLAISASLLTLTHIPSALMLVLILPVYVPVVIDWKIWKRVSAQLLSAVIIVGFSTAFYWIRVVTELPWVAHSRPVYTIGGYERGPALFPYSFFDPDAKFPYVMHLDFVTILTAALLVPSIALLFALRRKTGGSDIRVVFATSGAGLFAFFLLSRLSLDLWLNVELLQRLQYPWRFLAIITVLGVVSTALSLRCLEAPGMISARRASLFLMILIAVFVLADIRQVQRGATRILRPEFNELAERIRSERVAKHWWPVWAMPEAFEIGERALASRREVAIVEWGSEHRKFTVGEGPAGDVRVATFYYPYWTASVNGQDVEVRADHYGAILVPIGPEPSDIHFRFQEPVRYAALSYVSLAIWLILFGGSLALLNRRNKSAPVQHTEAGSIN
jgi:hypothetical protein